MLTILFLFQRHPWSGRLGGNMGVVSPWIYRGYYMAAQRYEISLRVLKNISQVSAVNGWNIFSTQKEKIRISKRPCNVIFIIINTNEIPNHFTLIVFWCERHDLLCSHSKGDIFTCEDNMLFSHVKISSFCTKGHLVFHCCLYNKCIHFPVCNSLRVSVLWHTWWYSVGVGHWVFQTLNFSQTNRICDPVPDIQQLLNGNPNSFAWLSDKTTKGA